MDEMFKYFPLRRKILEKLSDEELVRLALSISDRISDAYGEAVYVLRKRGTREIFEKAKELCEASTPPERSMGIDILAQLGWKPPEWLFRKESIPLLLNALNDSADEVVESAIYGLGHLGPEDILNQIISFKDNSNAEIRLAVTRVIGSIEGPNVISALLQLMLDEDSDVRDWATFAVGNLQEVDTPEIRAALLARLNDPDHDTSAEAVMGLASRGDPRVIGPIVHRLRSGDPGTLTIEAAETLGDSRFYSPLLDLTQDPWYRQKSWIWDKLNNAINACRWAKR